MTLAKEPLPPLADYPRPPAGSTKPSTTTARSPCPRGALRALAGHDLEELAVAVERHGADEGVVFHSAGGDEVFVIDPVPRVIGASDWSRLEAGLAQRVRALNAFVADIYGERRIVAEGVVPARVIEGAEYFEPGMQGVEPPGGLWIGVAGLDLVRDADGRFQVLEDNVRTPSGFAYAAAARRALIANIDVPRATARARSTRCRRCSATLKSASPRPGSARAVLLTDGEDNPAYYEHEWAAAGARRPAARAGRSTSTQSTYLPPHQRRPPRHQRRRAAARADPRGPDRGGQRVRHRGRRRQADARLRRGHDSLLRG